MTTVGQSVAATAWDQRSYQVRFDWGLGGLRRLAPADLTVVVDVLGLSASAQRIAGEAAAAGSTVFFGSLRNAAAVARAALAEQVARGERTSIAVIAVPTTVGPTTVVDGSDGNGNSGDGNSGGGEIFAVENLLGAGAVIDALATLGTDHSSPEAAVACEGFAGLHRAVAHLMSASGAGRALAEQGRADEVARASVLNDSDLVSVVTANDVRPWTPPQGAGS